ncbi:MAG TPA: hypothetical protein VK802_12780, partial [Streptosporangiaceae bacterium]|nr:hypothetical protein [Streptosporangiaceae bacterium]
MTRRRGTPPAPSSPHVGTLLRAGARCWRAGRAQVAVLAVAAVLAGLVPVAMAWLLRAVLDELAVGRSQHLIELVLVMGVVGAVSALLPSTQSYEQAQLSRAITRTGTAELFGSVTEIRGLRRLEDPAFQDRLRIAGQVGATAPGSVLIGGIGAVRSLITLGGFLGTLAV